MKKLIWFGVHGLFAAGMYFGLFRGVEGAENVVLFFAWLSIVMSLFVLSDSVIESRVKEKRSMPTPVNVAYNIAVAIAFAWVGFWVVASFWILHIILNEASWMKAKEES